MKIFGMFWSGFRGFPYRKWQRDWRDPSTVPTQFYESKELGAETHWYKKTVGGNE